MEITENQWKSMEINGWASMKSNGKQQESMVFNDIYGTIGNEWKSMEINENQ